MSRYEPNTEVLALIHTITAVVATELPNGQYSYKAESSDGAEYPLMAASNRLYLNVYFYKVGWVNGNAKGNALNGHATYGKNPSTAYKEHLIKTVPVVFEG